MIMCWRQGHILILSAALAVSVCGAWFWVSSAETKQAVRWTSHRKLTSREKTKDLWNHAFDNYMIHAFPMDELRPLSCTGRGPDVQNPSHWAVNDVLGNFSLTLIDVLDTFVVINDRRGFAQAVQNVISTVSSFDLDTKPQVFETNIRVLGGLLSAHQIASNPKHRFHLKWYKGELLRLAHDLGQRLLPAFKTPTGIPYARINLRRGIIVGESMETCTAGAGSLIIEFAVLSRLTGDPRFEDAAYKAFFAIWNRRSDIGLVGNTINVWTGMWLLPDVSGIGAGIDSFYEYALKWYILSGEMEFLDVWKEAYSNVMRYVRDQEGYWFRQVNMQTGELAYASTDSLSAFWSGLQVLSGDVQGAIRSHLIYWNLWRRFSGIPEVFDLSVRRPTSWQYPLRPEFIESTYLLYRATRDTFYLDVGERVLSDLILRSKVDCGLTSIDNLLTNKRDDRMESFVVSETLKYLYLLFDEDNLLHHDDSNSVWTTEGHWIGLPRELIKPSPRIRRQLRRVENLQCPAYVPDRRPSNPETHLYGLVGSIRTREDVEFARVSVGIEEKSKSTEDDSAYWRRDGWCASPRLDLYSLNFVLSGDGTVVPEDPSPDRTKLKEVGDGFVINNMTGIRAHFTSRIDGTGYDITRLGPYSVRSGQKVYFNDSSMNLIRNSDVNDEQHRDPAIQLHFYINNIDFLPQLTPGLEGIQQEITVTASTSSFGGDPSSQPRVGQPSLRFSNGTALPVIRPNPNNKQGCFAYDANSIRPDSVLFVERGNCTFLQKLEMGRAAGAAGVVVASNIDSNINPTHAEDELIREELAGVVLVVVGRSEAQAVEDILDFASMQGVDVFMSVIPPPAGASPSSNAGYGEQSPMGERTLYVNGRPLINVELLV